MGERHTSVVIISGDLVEQEVDVLGIDQVLLISAHTNGRPAARVLGFRAVLREVVR